jgi:hypothetical protein
MSDVWLRDSEDQDLYLWSMRRFRKSMAKLPEGRKALPKEWFIDRAKQISPMTEEERKRAKEKEDKNKQDDWDNWTDGDIG